MSNYSDFFSFEANARAGRNIGRAFGFGPLVPAAEPEPEPLEPEYIDEYMVEPMVVDFELEPVEELGLTEADIAEIEANQEGPAEAPEALPELSGPAEVSEISEV